MGHNGVIAAKLARLDDNLVKLERYFADVSAEQFQQDWAAQKVAERVLQVMVEIVIDIAERLIAMQNAGPVASSADALEKLAQLQIIAAPAPYVEMVRFRNLIVRQYESIAPETLYNIIANQLHCFRDFRTEVLHAL